MLTLAVSIVNGAGVLHADRAGSNKARFVCLLPGPARGSRLQAGGVKGPTSVFVCVSSAGGADRGRSAGSEDGTIPQF